MKRFTPLFALLCVACTTIPETLPDRPGASTLLVASVDPRLHGHPSWYAPSSDTIYVVHDHPIAGCVVLLEDHERWHRQQFYRGEPIDTLFAERQARMLSGSRNCSDGPRAPVLTQWHAPW